MKNKLLTLFSMIFIALLIINCGDSKQKATGFAPEEVVIPESLKGNKEVEEYFTTLSYSVDEFAYNIGEMAEDLKDMGVKEGDELTAMQKFKALKIFANYAVTMSQFMMTFAELEGKSQIIMNGLTDDEENAFEELFKRFDKRMQELDKKYNAIIEMN